MITMVPMIAGLEDDWIPSISDMDAAISNLQTRAQEFSKETFAAEVGDVNAQISWQMSWNKFIEDLEALKDGWWVNRWQRRSDILTMRQRFNDLVAWWHRIPGTPATTATPTFDPKQISPPGSGLEATVKWAAIGLVAIAAVAALAQVGGVIRLLPKERT